MNFNNTSGIFRWCFNEWPGPYYHIWPSCLLLRRSIFWSLAVVVRHHPVCPCKHCCISWFLQGCHWWRVRQNTWWLRLCDMKQLININIKLLIQTICCFLLTLFLLLSCLALHGLSFFPNPVSTIWNGSWDVVVPIQVLDAHSCRDRLMDAKH